jgi:hypothetical protein
MRIRLLKSWINTQGKKYPVGQILGISKGLALRMIAEGKAEEYCGAYPPPRGRKGKMKTNFFKPK